MVFLKKKSLSLFYWLIFFLVATLSSCFLILKIKNFENEISGNFLAQISFYPQKKQIQTLTMIFVGDIMLDRGVKWQIYKNGQGDWKLTFLKIADELKKADILFGNLESVISDKGRRIGSIYSFRAEPKSIEGLSFAGFDIVSVANNHLFDYGREAMEDSFQRLKLAGIDYVGAGFNEKEAYSPIIKEVKGTKVAFLAYTNLGTKQWSAKENLSGIAWLTAENLEKGIKKAKEKADLIVVSMHFGNEYQSSSSPEQKYFAHLAIDLGADLVVGHHPHVIQEIENYKKGYIAYSLGNFVFDQSFSEKTMRGILLKVLVENKKMKEVIPIKIKINQYFQPEIELEKEKQEN